MPDPQSHSLEAAPEEPPTEADFAAWHFDHAPCGYLSTSADGLILHVNRTLLTLTGYTRNELVGRRRFGDMLTAGGRIYHETHFAPMLRMQGHAREIAFELVAADGRRIPVLVNSTLHPPTADAPTLVQTAIFDATERRRYETELLVAKKRAEDLEAHARALADTLQQTFVPPSPPSIPGIDIAAAYRPAGNGDEVGGDFYDIFELDSDDWMITLGDVSGKGVDAALVTALARHTIRAAAVRQSQPHKVLHTLNEVLLRGESERFCTALLLRLRRRDAHWTCTVSSAGHPLPLFLRPGLPALPVGQPGNLLGYVDKPEFHSVDLCLDDGQGLLLYTDGATDGRHNQQAYGDRRLRATATQDTTSASSLVERVLHDILEFQTGVTNDDIALVAIIAR